MVLTRRQLVHEDVGDIDVDIVLYEGECMQKLTSAQKKAMKVMCTAKDEKGVMVRTVDPNYVKDKFDSAINPSQCRFAMVAFDRSTRECVGFANCQVKYKFAGVPQTHVILVDVICKTDSPKYVGIGRCLLNEIEVYGKWKLRARIIILQSVVFKKTLDSYLKHGYQRGVFGNKKTEFQKDLATFLFNAIKNLITQKAILKPSTKTANNASRVLWHDTIQKLRAGLNQMGNQMGDKLPDKERMWLEETTQLLNEVSEFVMSTHADDMEQWRDLLVKVPHQKGNMSRAKFNERAKTLTAHLKNQVIEHLNGQYYPIWNTLETLVMSKCLPATIYNTKVNAVFNWQLEQYVHPKITTVNTYFRRRGGRFIPRVNELHHKVTNAIPKRRILKERDTPQRKKYVALLATKAKARATTSKKPEVINLTGNSNSSSSNSNNANERATQGAQTLVGLSHRQIIKNTIKRAAAKWAENLRKGQRPKRLMTLKERDERRDARTQAKRARQDALTKAKLERQRALKFGNSWWKSVSG